MAFIDKPLIALPLAFAAHFALDALPHFAIRTAKTNFFYFLAADMGLAASLLLSMMLLRVPNWPWLVAGGVLCASPDLMWLYYLVYELKGKKKEKLDPVAAFHAKIQKYELENIWGLLIEIGWLFAGLVALFTLTV